MPLRGSSVVDLLFNFDVEVFGCDPRRVKRRTDFRNAA